MHRTLTILAIAFLVAPVAALRAQESDEQWLEDRKSVV